MTPPLYVRTKSSVMELVELFRKRRQTLAIAIDEHGAVDGLVTLNDVMGALVGDIATVEEEKERELVKRADGSWWIDGTVTIGRLKTGLDIDTMLPGEEQGGYHTLAGFVMEQLGRVPVVGDKFECVDWRWEVVDMDEKRIDKVLATPITARPQRPAETPW
jgi:putative hemolysin